MPALWQPKTVISWTPKMVSNKYNIRRPHYDSRVRLFHVVHVTEQSLYGYVTNGFFEEQSLYSRLPDGPQVRQHEQQSSEPGGLS